MSLQLSPLTSPIQASLTISGSKSYTNRALILAALNPKTVTIHNPVYCDDTEAMIECLRRLGLSIKTFPEKIILLDSIFNLPAQYTTLFARDSGTTARFLLALLCLTPGEQILTGSENLKKRPIQPLVEALQALGAQIQYLEKAAHLPLKITSSHLVVNAISLPGDISSQFFSSLLMILPHVPGLEMTLPENLISKPYVEMTLAMMKDYLHQEDFLIEGDFSSASYFFAIAALTRSTLCIHNLNPASKQADCYFLSLLESMGNAVHYSKNSVTMIGDALKPMRVDMTNCPDQIQTMAVLMAFVPSISEIYGVRSLRFKETDRVLALQTELAKMAIKTEATENSLTIYGGTLKPARIETYNDHRMAMAFAVAGSLLPGVQIANPEVVNKSFPDFWQKLKSIGVGVQSDGRQ